MRMPAAPAWPAAAAKLFVFLAPALQWVECPPGVTTSYTWNGTEFIAPPGPVPPTKEELLQQINQAVNQYIFQYYDAGTQISFNSIYVHPATEQEAKTALESVWAWISSIMQYYYTQKAQIESSVITSATWDFTQFDATKPPVTLASLMS